MRGRAGRIDHDDVVEFMQFADERHDLGFVQFMHDRNRVFGGSRDPVGERVVEIRVDRRDFQAGKRGARE